MALAALGAWVLTALGGFVMLAKWISRGGLRQQRDGTTQFPAGLVFGHFALAAAGLVLWIAYLLLHITQLAWAAFIVLLPVALLGFTMFARWTAARRSTVGVGSTGISSPGGSRPAEQTLPVPVVAAHGVFAVATVVLVLLAALAA